MSECLCFCMCGRWGREREEEEVRIDVDISHIVKTTGFHVIAKRKLRDTCFW